MRAALLCLSIFLLGCAATSEREGLPTGVTLLGSDEGFCDGPIEFDADPDVMVDQGDSTTLAVDDEDDIEWECLAAGSRGDEQEMDCPDGTSYLRITRNEDEEAFTVECFGS